MDHVFQRTWILSEYYFINFFIFLVFFGMLIFLIGLEFFDNFFKKVGLF